VISSRNQGGIIRSLSELPLVIIFNAWWALMNVGSKCHIAWSNSRHAPSWGYNLHCRNEETGSTGVIYIVCHQVLRHPSEHGTSYLGKQLLANDHIAKLNKLKEWEVTELTTSMVHGTALAILRR